MSSLQKTATARITIQALLRTTTKDGMFWQLIGLNCVDFAEVSREVLMMNARPRVY